MGGRFKGHSEGRSPQLDLEGFWPCVIAVCIFGLFLFLISDSYGITRGDCVKHKVTGEYGLVEDVSRYGVVQCRLYDGGGYLSDQDHPIRRTWDYRELLIAPCPQEGDSIALQISIMRNWVQRPARRT